jgi:hypothetical protein
MYSPGVLTALSRYAIMRHIAWNRKQRQEFSMWVVLQRWTGGFSRFSGKKRHVSNRLKPRLRVH